MEHIFGLNYQKFFRIVDNMYDEILVYDNNYNIVYINKACSRHYGCSPRQMIGKSFYDFISDDWWGPSILPIVYRDKRSYAIRQSTYLGAELLTIAVPLFDGNNDIEFVVMNVRDNVNDVDLYNPQYYINLPKGVISPPIGKSSEMRELLRLVNRLSQSNVPCIFVGETGVGKTAMAQYLHSISLRKDQSMAIFDCSAMSDERSTQELFGTDEMPGLFYKMRNGTLLLKNINCLSLNTQSRLLKSMEDGQMLPDDNVKSPRILATSTKDLKLYTRNGLFLEKLYYQLNIAKLNIPPLRDRKMDIRPLIYYFLGSFCSKYRVNRTFSAGAIQALVDADWPDNVSELRHTIEQLVVMTDNPVIDINQLPKRIFGIVDSDESSPSNRSEGFDIRVANFESALIHDAYEKYGSSRKIAEHLGISQTKANNLIRKYIKNTDAR